MSAEDTLALERRDQAAAKGCRMCPECTGTGEVWVDVYVIDGWSVSSRTCPTCKGETWVDQDGKPYRIDPNS